MNDNLPFMSDFNPIATRPALQQTIPFTIKQICCPKIKLLSITTILTVILIFLYIICLFQGINSSKNILQIKTDVLLQFGAMQDLLLKKAQVQRLLTASFLHMNLLHITMNVIILAFLLSRLERLFKFQVVAFILLASAIAGNALSALCNSTGTVSAGVSSIIFGIMGTFLAFMTVNWATLARQRQVRSQLCFTIGLLVFFSLLFSIGSDIDFYSHIGGMIGGYLIALFLIPGIQEKRKLFNMVGSVGYAVFLFGTLLTFFLVK